MSKNFPFTRGGPSKKKNFFQSEHVSSQIWCQKIFPLLRPGPPPPPVQGWISLPKNLRPGTPPPQGWISLSKNLRPGTPLPPGPRLDWDLSKAEGWIGNHPPPLNRHTPVKTYLPSYVRTRAVNITSPNTNRVPPVQ